MAPEVINWQYSKAADMVFGYSPFSAYVQTFTTENDKQYVKSKMSNDSHSNNGNNNDDNNGNDGKKGDNGIIRFSAAATR